MQLAERLSLVQAENASSPRVDFSPVVERIEECISDAAAPGVVMLVAQHGQVCFEKALGTKAYRTTKMPDPSPMRLDTVFDLAALTGAVVTTTLAMKLVEAGMFNLDDRVGRYEQPFAVLGKSGITIRQLLNHSAGLPAWHPYFEELLRENAGPRRGIITSRGARDYVFNAINRLQVKPGAIGARQLYSDLGMMLMGHLIEQLTGVGLEKAAHRLIFQPLGMKSTSFVDLSMIKRRGIHPVTDLIAPTEECAWRRRLLCGEVHDDNAWVMGGISGHSGLFSTARDLHQIASALLHSYHGESNFLDARVVRDFWKPSAGFPEGWRCGWDSPGRENGMLESGLSSSAVGMNGFTGCSLWMEPDSGLEVVVLSNRVCPSRNNKKFLAVRPELHRRVLDVMGRVRSASDRSA